MVRYIAWAIPSIGFIGTVRGIGDALGQAHKAVEGDIAGVTQSLGVAFNSTFVALLISILVMFLLHQLQLDQERLVLDTETYLDRTSSATCRSPEELGPDARPHDAPIAIEINDVGLERRPEPARSGSEPRLRPARSSSDPVGERPGRGPAQAALRQPSLLGATRQPAPGRPVPAWTDARRPGARAPLEYWASSASRHDTARRRSVISRFPEATTPSS